MRGYLEDLKAGGRPMTDKELAEHYKHLYSEVKKEKDSLMTALTTSREKYNNDKARYRRKYKNLKKQKDDVVKVLKALKHRILYEEDFRIDDYIDDDFIDDLLRMLGEIDG